MRHATRVLLGLLLGALLPSIAMAQAFPTLTSITPQGGQRGGTVHVVLTGDRLGPATALLFDRSGVDATIASHTGHKAVTFSGAGVSASIADSGRLGADVVIAADAPIGVHNLRVSAPDGISNAVPFLVGDLPELAEAEPNDTSEAPQALSPPVTVSGNVASKDDEDVFSFTATEGQRLLLSVTASRMGSPLDSYLRLFDPAGEQVADNDIANALDSLIDYTVPADGTYTLSIRDRRYQGSPRHVYRLSIGVTPYLDELFPLGGRRGTDTTVAVAGRNLAGITSMRVSVAPDAPLGATEARVTVDSGLTTNARPFAVGDLPEMTETEPNNDADESAEVTAPITVNGRVGEEGDVDHFVFTAEAGQRLAIEVNAARLGSKLDGLLTLTHAPPEPATDAETMDAQPDGDAWAGEDSPSKESGAEPETGEAADDGPLAVSDDALGADPRIDYTFTDAGRYVVALRDLTGRGGSDFAYRLSIAPLRPDFQVAVNPAEGPRPDVPSRGVARIAPGGSAALALDVSRIDGFNGAVRFECVGLPADYAESAAIVGSGQTRVLMTLTAPWDAQPGVIPLSIVGIAAVNGSPVRKVADPATFLLTVTAPPAFTLAVADAALTVQQGKDVTAHVAATRADGFDGPITVSLVGLPGQARATAVTIPTGETTAAVTVHAWTVPSRNPILAVPNSGTVQIAAKGSATIGGMPVTAYAPAFPITIVEAPFTVNVEPARQSFLLAAQPEVDEASTPEGTTTDEGADATDPVEGMDADFTVVISRRGGFTDAVGITVDDLPEGLTASWATVPEHENDATITLTATPTLTTGDHTIRFTGRATVNGAEFTQASQAVVIKVLR